MSGRVRRPAAEAVEPQAGQHDSSQRADGADRPGRRKERVDRLVVEQGLAASRSKAQALVLAGQVFAGEERIDKPGHQLASGTPLRLTSGPRFVSRGGDKLEHGCQVFEQQGLTVRGKICLDVGAATGGFTDCLLQRGARRVFAVDVGYGLLDAKLRSDGRVVVRERVNARYLRAEDFPDPIDLIVVDASFIGIAKLLDGITATLPPAGELIALLKPQFEAGRAEAARGRGVIRDERVRQQAIATGRAALVTAGFDILAETDSPLRGPKGNLEHLLYARRQPASARQSPPSP